MLDGECLVHDKEKFCIKTHFFAKKCYIFYNNVPIKRIYPSIYLEMEELQLRLLEKQLMTKFFLFWGKKAIFAQKLAAPSKKGYSPKYVYWYQCFSV